MTEVIQATELSQKEIDIYRYIDIYLRINNNRQQQKKCGVLFIVHNSQRDRLKIILEQF